MGRVTVIDNVVLQPLSSPEKIKDFYFSQEQQGQPLRVRVAATHAGRVTRNNAFYLPDKVRSSTSSWVSPHPKPVLVHHNDHGDPIGRIVDARYVDTSNGFRDAWIGKLKDSTQAMSSALLDAFVSGKLSPREMYDVASSYFINDLRITDDPSYEGLGYIELVIDVTDVEAAQKILDQRYLTGSIGASSDSAVCSICKVDWASDDGICEHRPGEIYDGKKCILIAGAFVYDEYSFVNKPADTLSRVLRIDNTQVKDFVVDMQSNVKIPSVSLFIDRQEEKRMTFTVEDGLTLLKDKFSDMDESAVSELNEKVFTSLPEDFKDSTEEKSVLEQMYLEALSSVEKKDAPDPVRDYFGDTYDLLVGDDPSGRVYADMLFSLADSTEDEDQRRLVDKMISDSVLTSEHRAKLLDSAFCGPDRTFPVYDCCSYKAAVAHLVKQEDSDENSKIREAVERKGKRLGCGDKKDKKDAVNPLGQFVPDWFDKFSDTDLSQLSLGLTSVAKERTLTLSDENTEALTVLQDENKTLKEEVSSLKDQLTTVKTETEELQGDIETLEDALTRKTETLQTRTIKSIVDFKKLAGEVIEDETSFMDSLKGKSFDECDLLLSDCVSKVDLVDIHEKISSGLARQPQGTVDNPALIQDNINNPATLTVDTLRLVRDKYIELRLTHNQFVADAYLEDMKAKGVIPKSNPFEKLED